METITLRMIPRKEAIKKANIILSTLLRKKERSITCDVVLRADHDMKCLEIFLKRLKDVKNPNPYTCVGETEKNEIYNEGFYDALSMFSEMIKEAEFIDIPDEYGYCSYNDEEGIFKEYNDDNM